MTRSPSQPSTTRRRTAPPQAGETKAVSTKSKTRAVSAATSKGVSGAPKAMTETPKAQPRHDAPSGRAAAPIALEMKKQDLIQRVVEQSGIKKQDAKPVIEAMLDILGAALAEGRELNLQPLGKVKLNRIKETTNARIIVAKIRQSKSYQSNAKDKVAAAAE